VSGSGINSDEARRRLYESMFGDAAEASAQRAITRADELIWGRIDQVDADRGAEASAHDRPPGRRLFEQYQRMLEDEGKRIAREIINDERAKLDRLIYGASYVDQDGERLDPWLVAPMVDEAGNVVALSVDVPLACPMPYEVAMPGPGDYVMQLDQEDAGPRPLPLTNRTDEVKDEDMEAWARIVAPKESREIIDAYARYDSDPRVSGPDDFEAFSDAVRPLLDQVDVGARSHSSGRNLAEMQYLRPTDQPEQGGGGLVRETS
jgi:hypothetical protein